MGSNKENKLGTEYQENGKVEDSTSTKENGRLKPCFSKYYQVGSLVDVKDVTVGAWFEGRIVNICKAEDDFEVSNKVHSQSGNLLEKTDTELDTCKLEVTNLDPAQNLSIVLNDCFSPAHDKENRETLSENRGGEVDQVVYEVEIENYKEEEPLKLRLEQIRPRARTVVKFDDIEEGEIYMVNYCIEEPDERGYWYDCLITKVKNARTVKQLYGTIYVGPDSVPLDNCKIIFIDEVFKIEEKREIDFDNEENQTFTSVESPAKRQVKPDCSHCKDVASRRCYFCSCHICGGKDEPAKQIMCDECDMSYHVWCLTPPLDDVPDVEEWYCPECKNDETEVVRAGEKLKESRKKAKMASANCASSRDWGKGMACVGRTRECTLVPPNHFGSIPGIEVGKMWKFRVQGSEAGVHRPHVAGIHGRENEGAYSIVLAGGYEDDADNGEEFFYTGSGGRDLSGNKRTAEQSCDQTLTRMNKALALNCAAVLNAKTGAGARNWKEGKPVRVLRSYKGRKNSDYCPEDGIRYDGLYKVVKYWSEKGKSGFLVWRYFLRRDDPAPAPWTKAGKKRIKELGLTMEYPEGYLEALTAKVKTEPEDGKKGKGKRSRGDLGCDSPSLKKKKLAVYQIPGDISKLIKKDKLNQKLWNECIAVVKEGQQVFLKKVQELFLCVCCQEVVFYPVTTKCSHNICKSCLQRSFHAEVYSCPACRTNLGKKYSLEINKSLGDVLQLIFPGYEAGRL
ncbi:E3 ubiquitin-protein ligase UHRF1-like isoform X2 [Tachypleus tridentatus]